LNDLTIQTGLGEAEAAARLRRDGYNELPTHGPRNALRILASVLREPMFALLLGAAAIYLAIGNLKEAVVLVLFATTSVSIALVQETRTERVLDSLRELTSPRALVIRDGVERVFPFARSCAATSSCSPRATGCRPMRFFCRHTTCRPTSLC